MKLKHFSVDKISEGFFNFICLGIAGSLASKILLLTLGSDYKDNLDFCSFFFQFMPVMLGDDEILNRVPFTNRSICPLMGFFPAFHSFFSPTISAVAGGHLIRFHESVYGHYFGALPSLMPWIIDGSWISMQEFNSFIYLYPGQGFQ